MIVPITLFAPHNNHREYDDLLLTDEETKENYLRLSKVTCLFGVTVMSRTGLAEPPHLMLLLS